MRSEHNFQFFTCCDTEFLFYLGGVAMGSTNFVWFKTISYLAKQRSNCSGTACA